MNMAMLKKVSLSIFRKSYFGQITLAEMKIAMFFINFINKLFTIVLKPGEIIG